MPIKGISDARDPVEDRPDYSEGDQLPDGQPWPPLEGPALPGLGKHAA